MACVTAPLKAVSDTAHKLGDDRSIVAVEPETAPQEVGVS